VIVKRGAKNEYEGKYRRIVIDTPALIFVGTGAGMKKAKQ